MRTSQLGLVVVVVFVVVVGGGGGIAGCSAPATAIDGGVDATAAADLASNDAAGTSLDAASLDLTSAADASSGAQPHPLYPALDIVSLPGTGGGSFGAYEVPLLPATTRTVTVSSTGAQAANELLSECQLGATAVTVPNAAGHLGVVNLGNVDDCDISLGADVVIDFLYLGNLPGPTRAPSHRVRIRGGQIGNIFVAPQTTDLVFDGVALNNAVVAPAARQGTGIYLMDDGTQADGVVNRFAFVRSFVRMLPTVADGAGNTDGSAFLGANARNVFFADNNIVTAGNRNAWGFRLSGGSNTILIDNTVRVSFHKLVRMNDAPVDYVYIKNGVWMRQATLTAGGLSLNDSFAQIGDDGTDRIFVHDPSVYLLSDQPVAFGATFGAGQAGKSWEARRIHWYAQSAAVVSDTHLGNLEGGCVGAASCDYGIGTHQYTYDSNVSFPAAPWRDLPTFTDDDPDHLPVAN